MKKLCCREARKAGQLRQGERTPPDAAPLSLPLPHLDDVLLLGARGDHDDGQVHGGKGAAHLHNYVKAANAGHHAVEQHEVGPCVARAQVLQ